MAKSEYAARCLTNWVMANKNTILNKANHITVTHKHDTHTIKFTKSTPRKGFYLNKTNAKSTAIYSIGVLTKY